ncbi:class I SAM-dependent methyltransferase [Cystobacter ferrugineus]|uniref:Methyltransferase type 11 domain-containing protein n=1 Tax=Cystobacter ferrugineus TaxID=83449 RepID=A0A1L9B9R4_9BACT|nr:class I SAM-dependent methyltransferase [Cystobacter ferrugineus]OJH38985.1 hypothetical protein BON30_22535 [Cystobacter ferrugineus]
MRFLKKLLFDQSDSALSRNLRRKRFGLFRSLLDSLPRPLRILDVGGTQSFWEELGFSEKEQIEFVIFNVSPSRITRPNFTARVGDARDMHEFRDGQFDVVFSNSVIEHVGSFEDQRRMANEVRRVGRRYFVQTPNRGFPMEPHFMVPFFQFMPTEAKIFLAMHFDLGWTKKRATVQEARELVESIRLLTEPQMRQLFPSATMQKEEFLGLTKSFIVYEGWEREMDAVFGATPPGRSLRTAP